MSRKWMSSIVACGLVLASCGGATRNSQSSDTTERVRNAALPTDAVKKGGLKLFSVKGLGSSLVSGLAVSAIGMGLGAIPGMPKEIAALFGGGGSDNAEVLKAIAELKKMIEDLDKKVDDVQKTLDQLSADVSVLSTKVDRLAENLCGLSAKVQIAPLKSAMVQIDADWQLLYGNQGAAYQSFTEMDRLKSLAISSEIDGAMKAAYDSIKSNPSLRYAQSVFASTLLSEKDDRGLIAQMQACTLTEKRYLTTNDTKRWRTFVEQRIYDQYKALQLSIFASGYKSYEDAKAKAAAAGVAFDPATVEPDLREVGRLVTEFLSTANSALFMVQADIPEGQVFDTVSRKMWTVRNGSGSMMLKDAMNTCIAADQGITNTAPIVGANETSAFPLGNCPTSSGLDGIAAKEGHWRVPHLWEVSNAMLSQKKTGWFNASLGPSLIDGGDNGVSAPSSWTSTTKCGGTKCTNPLEYLRAEGASILADRLGSGVVWTTTSYAATYNDASANRTATNPNIALVNTAFTSTNNLDSVAAPASGWAPYVASGGWRGGSLQQTAISNTCKVEPQQRHGGTMKACTTLYNEDWWNDRCEQWRTNKPVLHGLAEAHVVNLGPVNTWRRVLDSSNRSISVPATFGDIAAGGTGRYYASQSRVDKTFSCTDYDSPDFWGRWSIDEFFRNYLPQDAAQLLVRDLRPNEIYYYIDGNDTLAKSWDTRRALEAPVVNVTTNDTSYRIDTVNAFKSDVEVRCAIDPAPAFVPRGWNDMQKCSVGLTRSVAIGDHNVYAMAQDTVTKQTSPLLVATFNTQGAAPRPPSKVNVSSGNATINTIIEGRDDRFSYTVDAAPSGGGTKATCRIAAGTSACSITGVENGRGYAVTVSVASGARSIVTQPIQTTPVAPPPPTTSTSTSSSSSSSSSTSSSSPASSTTAAPSPTVTTIALPTTPGAPRVVAGDGSAAITVRPIADVGIDSYLIVTNGDRATCTVTVPADSCVVTGLVNGFTYSFAVVARRGQISSAASPWSESVKPLPVPKAPAAIHTTSTDTTLKVSVAGALGSAAIDGYRVSIEGGSSPVEPCEVAGTSAECTFDNLERGTTYSVTAVAINSSGPSKPAKRSFTLPALPAAPAGVTPVPGDGVVTVEVKAPDSKAPKFIVAASPSNETCEVIAPAVSCDMKLSNGKSYTFSVVAVSDTGERSKPVRSSAVTPTAPPVASPPPAPAPVSTTQKVETLQAEQVPTAIESQPVPDAAKIPANVPTVKVGQTIAANALRTALPASLAKATNLKLAVRPASKALCSTSAKGVKGLKSGNCVVKVTGRSKIAGVTSTRSANVVVVVIP